MNQPEIEIESELKGIDWTNDSLFYTHSWWDETSQFDPQGRWCYGIECYEREYKVRVPIAFKDCDELVEQFVNMMIDNYPYEQGFYVEEEKYD